MFKTVGVIAAVVVTVAGILGGLYLFFRTGAIEMATDVAHVRSAPYFLASEHALSLDPGLNTLLAGT